MYLLETWQTRETTKGKDIGEYKEFWKRNGTNWEIFLKHNASDDISKSDLSSNQGTHIKGLKNKAAVFEYALVYAKNEDSLEHRLEAKKKIKVFCGAVENAQIFFAEDSLCINPLQDYMKRSLEGQKGEKRKIRAILVRMAYSDYVTARRVQVYFLAHVDYAWNHDKIGHMQRNVVLTPKSWMRACLPCFGSFDVKSDAPKIRACNSSPVTSGLPTAIGSDTYESTEYFWSIAIVSSRKNKAKKHEVDFISKGKTKSETVNLDTWMETNTNVCAKNWEKNTIVYNDQPPSGKLSKEGHCKGVIKVDDQESRIGWLAHSAPKWPKSAEQVKYEDYEAIHEGESADLHHQHMTWVEFPYSHTLLVQIRRHLESMKAHIYDYTGIFEDLEKTEKHSKVLKFEYRHLPLSKDGNLVHITKTHNARGLDIDTRGNSKDDHFEAAVEFGDIYRYLQAGFAPNILINSWMTSNKPLRDSRDRQKSGKSYGAIRRSVSMHGTEIEDVSAQNSHCKVACAENNLPYAFTGDLNDDKKQHHRGGGFFVLRDENAAKFLRDILRGGKFSKKIEGK